MGLLDDLKNENNFIAGLVGPILKALDKSAPEFGATK